MKPIHETRKRPINPKTIIFSNNIINYQMIIIINISLLLIFTGCLTQNKRYRRTASLYSGLKTINYKNGSKYTGMFENGEKNGRGTYTWANGMEYFGDFVNDKMTGQGELTWPSGNRYTGTFVNNKRTGMGRQDMIGGVSFSGVFTDGTLIGQGSCTWPTGIKYSGMLNKGKMVGQGFIKWPDGSSYVGEFNGNKGHKKGVLTSSDAVKHPGNLRFNALIFEVMKNSNGEKNGLMAGDIVLKYDGIPIINGQDTLISLSQQTQQQSKIELEIMRERKKKKIHIEGGKIGIKIGGHPVFEYDNVLAAPVFSLPVFSKDLEKKSSEKIDYGNYNALVIGINKYKYLPDLKTAENDARDITRLLIHDYGFKVKLLMNPTRSKIISALSVYRKTLLHSDNLLIYYAGHGWLDKDANEGYWLPADSTREDESNWISNATINSSVRAMKAKHIMIVADSCYSGKLIRGLHIRQRTPNYLQRIVSKKARVVLTSGGLEPVADGGGKGKHSVFASAFIGTLKENNGVLDGTSLFTRIRRPVMVNADQTPEYADIRKTGHDGGDFLFVRIK